MTIILPDSEREERIGHLPFSNFKQFVVSLSLLTGGGGGGGSVNEKTGDSNANLVRRWPKRIFSW